MIRLPKCCSYRKTNTHSDGECLRQQALRAERRVVQLRKISRAPTLIKPMSPNCPRFGFSFAAVGASEAVSRSPASAIPAAAGIPVLALGSPPSAMLKRKFRCSLGVFGAYGATYMAMSTVWTSVDPDSGGLRSLRPSC